MNWILGKNSSTFDSRNNMNTEMNTPMNANRHHAQRSLSTCVLAGTLALVMPALASGLGQINEDKKFLPPGGTAGDWLGSSIAIDGSAGGNSTDGFTVVGAMLESRKGGLSGTAYLFNADGANPVRLDAIDGVAGDFFGSSVDIDNGTIAIGAYGDDDAVRGDDSGSVYLFAGDRTQLGNKLVAPDGAFNDRFGYSVAIENGIVAVGAYADDDNGHNSGSVYLFDAGTQTQLMKLTASDGAAMDFFGYSVAIDDGIVTVGAIGDNGFMGSVYVFDASTGVELAKLVPSDGEEFDWFGSSVAVSGDVVAVGAPLHDGAGFDSGSAYLFDIGDLNTVVQTKLLPSGGAANDQFGHSVSIDAAGVVAAGAIGSESLVGSVYLFDASDGTQIKEMISYGGVAGDRFGHAVAIRGGKLAVGAVYDSDQGVDAGGAYLFDVTDPLDTQAFGARVARLFPTGTAHYGNFGFSVDLDGSTMVVGANHDNAKGFRSGAAYLINTDTGAWLHKLVPDDGSERDDFGYSVSIDHGVVAVGARQDDFPGGDITDDQGSAYIFDALTGKQLKKLVATNGGPIDQFGFSVSVDFKNDGSGALLGVGAPNADLNGPASGLIYMFDADPSSVNFGNPPPGIGPGWLYPNNPLANSGYGVSVSVNYEAYGGVGTIAGGANSQNTGFLFRAPGDAYWTELDPHKGEHVWFGRSISVGENYIAVGSPLSDSSRGAAYIFEMTGSSPGTGLLLSVARSIDPSGSASDQYGRSVAIDNGLLVVGARHNQDSGFDSGAAFYHHIDPNAKGGLVSDPVQLGASDAGPGQFFGTAVAVSNNTIIVGALNAGVYLFSVSASVSAACVADLTGDGMLDFLDVSAFMVAFGEEDPAADLSGDGSIDFIDISAFLTAFSVGCP